jgi:hypothetical protein
MSFDNSGMPSPADPGSPLIPQDTPAQPSPAPAVGGPDPADPGLELLLGKFPNTPEGRLAANQAYWNAVAEMNRTKAINDDYMARDAARPQQPQQREIDPFAELEALGVNRETWLKAMLSVVDARVVPMQNGIQAHAQFEQDHPDYVTHRVAVSKFISERPDLANDSQPIYQANGYRGLEWAWDRYREAMKMNKPASAADDPSKGSLPASGTSPRATADENKYDPAKAAAAKQHMDETGDQTPWLREIGKKFRPIY